MSEDLFQRHRALLEKALDVCAERYAWTAFPESPSSKVHGKAIPAEAKTAFEELLGQPFQINVPGSDGWVGEEVSPFTQDKLGVNTPNRIRRPCSTPPGRHRSPGQGQR